MAPIVGSFGDYDPAYLDRVRFYSPYVNSIISNQRVSKDQYLPGVRRIGQGFDITRHSGIEDNLAGARPRLTIGQYTLPHGAVIQREISGTGYKKIAPTGAISTWFSFLCSRWFLHTEIEFSRHSRKEQVFMSSCGLVSVCKRLSMNLIAEPPALLRLLLRIYELPSYCLSLLM